MNAKLGESAPLYQALMQHKSLGRASYHTPGHKSRGGVFPADLLSLDYTELPDTDSLFEAEGPILEAERKAANLFGAHRTVFSAGGCTLCIQAMLRAAAPQGGEVVTGRIIHRSAVNTMALLGICPVWVLPRPDAGPGLPGRIHPNDVQQALREHPGAKAVYLTSPDYYGTLADIAGIARVCRQAGVPLLVDNAHGAHLWYVGGGMHPITQGADYSACSAHKTLPVLTGGAWLNIREEKWSHGIKEAMALFGSTSPSYPVMASLDLCREWLEMEGEAAFARLEEQVGRLKRLAAARGFGQPEGVCDPVRLTLNTASVGMEGQKAAQWLRERGIEPEYADAGHVVFILTPMNTQEDLVRLEQALLGFPIGSPLTLPKLALPPLPVKAADPREAVLASAEWIPLDQSVGRVAAQAACPCPPGVPVVMPGETVSEKTVEFLSNYRISTIKVIK
ncbi:MAG: aminotransferase class V-fold PLP-dependent enzyme [Clostridiales bacterium]|jgi:arginine decarboxylase|nr:aminotransferase class V-fold PLP-dependent enzyme [Clostridiales bacterium]